MLLINQNLFGAGTEVREEYLDGVKCVVAPCAMLEEGVWEGSGGPVFYPDAELAKSARVWNQKPIVVNHPQDEAGNYISASLQPVIERSQIGILLNTRHDKKLRTECWFYEEKANRVDSRILANVKGKSRVETSTGLDADRDETEGEYNGKAYKIIARNHRPDHLAILPDKLGAYSVADGGGLFANEKALEETAKELPESLRVTLARKLERAYAEGGIVLTANQLSYDERTRQIAELLRDKYGKPGQYWRGHVHEVYDGYAVFCNEDYDFFLQKFKMKDNRVALEGEPKEARRVVEYVTANGSSFAANSAGALEVKEKVVANNQFDKKAHVDSLIGKGGWTEQDRESLMGMADGVLQKIIVPDLTANNEKKEEKKETPPPAPTKVTFKEVLANSDAATQARFAELERIEKETKVNLVNQIKANPNNKFEDNYLMSQDIPFLQTLAALAKVEKPAEGAAQPVDLNNLGNNGPVPMYYGMGGTLLANQGGIKAPEPLIPLACVGEAAK